MIESVHPHMTSMFRFVASSTILLIIRFRFLYRPIVCIDANFRLKNQLVSSYSMDPGLGIGLAYMVPRKGYEDYVLSKASDTDVGGFCTDFFPLLKFSAGQHLRRIFGSSESEYEVLQRPSLYRCRRRGLQSFRNDIACFCWKLTEG